ncbi:hypothetical protein [Brevibacterium iodinum]|uniref:hypothetical protein n=1 Tax=Brevibacterium iodinum TaxID=31943 RepID=UPI0011AF94C3|nr:hypothetical protein [Brevibacterium iodinum]
MARTIRCCIVAVSMRNPAATSAVVSPERKRRMSTMRSSSMRRRARCRVRTSSERMRSMARFFAVATSEQPPVVLLADGAEDAGGRIGGGVHQ